MADKKISELTALTSVTDTDKFAIVDDSATETKHVVRDDIFGQGLSSADSPTFVTGTFTGNLTVVNAQPTFQFTDADGTNQYGQVLQAGANTIIRSRNDSANGGVVIAGFGGGVNTNFATWAAGGKFTMIYGVAMTGLPTSASGLSAGDIWNNSGVLNIV